ncbi:MAG: response regulator FixJ [Syntrophorhabdaceae bacterium PtaU1.Bin034]|jgi:FixJ family two-component response regulator|nr:MAG: response regulator FixJ [Syntrophorhabdaceae bacterium PtaU1.Bin034]
MEDPDGFGLIIADQRMPDMKGTEIAEKVLQVRPDMPVIVVSGTSSGTREEADGVGAYWLEKPLLKEELSKAVEKALRS